MSSKWRRFEVLLPQQFNDGRDVPTECLAEAILEVVNHFGAASYETGRTVFEKPPNLALRATAESKPCLGPGR